MFLWNGVGEECQRGCYQPLAASSACSSSTAVLVSWFVAVAVATDSVKVGRGPERRRFKDDGELKETSPRKLRGALLVKETHPVILQPSG